MIDWTEPQPSYEDLHAQLDALRTERNAAAAEAKMWKDRYYTTLQELRQAEADRDAAMRALTETQAAMTQLEFRHRMLEVTADGLVHAP